METDTMMRWVDCFGGPADGEQVPMYPDDPLPSFPYLVIDGATYTYYLYENGAGDFRYVLSGALVEPPWLPFLNPHD